MGYITDPTALAMGEIDTENPVAIEQDPYGSRIATGWPSNLLARSGAFSPEPQLSGLSGVGVLPGGHYHMNPGAFGASPGGAVLGAALPNDALKKILTVVAIGVVVAVVLHWLSSRGGSAAVARRNPDTDDGAGAPIKGKSRMAKVYQSTTGTWWYRSMRKRARRQGPFASRADAAAHADSKGLAILE